MKKTGLVVGVIGVIFVSLCNISFAEAYQNNNIFQQIAISEDLYGWYHQNDIMFYDPTCNYNKTQFSGNCGGDITSEDAYERMKEVTRKYGTLAMNLQITYGVPWEFILGQMGPESGVGTAGIAKTELKDGKYNWMGLSCFSLPCPAQYGNHNNGDYPRPKGEGSWYEAYDSIELMLKSYASGDFARNGAYDNAFKYTDKNSYDLTKYAVSAFSVYVGRKMSADDWYVQTTFDYIEKAIRPVAEELGWPTSGELQKQKNIAIGGKFPIGTSKDQIYDDSVTCTSMPNDETEDKSKKNTPTGGATCVNLAEKRTKMWNEASQADKEHFMYVVSQEDHSIAGVEGYMNQIISKHYNNGTLSGWLSKQCPAFRGGLSCSGSHKITAEEQGWIDEALAGSNNIRFALGNATGGSGVGAGKIVCVWDGSKCRDDVDYNKASGKAGCNTYSPSESYGECWGLEGEDEWVNEMAQNCVSGDCKQGDFVHYNQCDSKWAEVPYGDYGNVCSSGCGPTSFAMLATVLLGESITPDETTTYAGEQGQHKKECGGSCGTLTKVLADHYDLEYKDLSNDEGLGSKSDSEIISVVSKYLKDGWMMHVSGAGSAPFSSGGHYIGIRGITNSGKWLLADSSDHGGGTGTGKRYSTIEWDPEDVLNAGMHHWNIRAIRAKSGGYGNINCGKVCEGDNDVSNDVGDTGLTIEQAKQFMMNYGANKNNSSKDAVGSFMWDICNGGGSNCVTFSAFFMVKFAGIPASGQWGDGQQVVDNLRARGSVDATFGNDPKVYAILSTPRQHTAVVLGHYDGKWVIGHASCNYSGRGKGNGGDGSLDGSHKGGGSGFIAIEESDNPADWQWVNAGYEFAYPNNVNVTKIGEYLKNGE